MKGPLFWKTLAIALVIVFSVTVYVMHGRAAVQKEFPERSDFTVADYARNGVRLGLDLRGGMHLVLQVITRDALRAEADQTMARVESLAREKGAATARGRKVDEVSFALDLGQATDPAAVKSAVTDVLGTEWQLNDRGDSWYFTFSPAARRDIETQAVTQSVETIRNRVDEFGVGEYVIQQQEGNRILVQLPGIDDPTRAKNLIGRTAHLELKLVDGPAAGSEQDLLARFGGALPAEVQVLPSATRRDAGGTEEPRVYYAVKRVAAISGRDLKGAKVTKDEFGTAAVDFSLNAEGARKFRAATGANVGKQLAIVLDERVQSAPTIEQEISDSGIIRGSFTDQEATDLALVLRAGALPAGLVFLEERTVGPSLGLDSIRAGITAAIVGSIAVFVFMLIYYKLAGANAVVALLLNVVLLMGALALFDATLTLPGLAGIVLTVGMAVDSNVLVFERIREELRRGKTVRSAIEAGFDRAFATVIDTHLTTLISAVFLFQFGTGPIKGFAVTLVIGLIASVFTAFFVSKVMFEWMYRDPRAETISI